MSDPSTLVVGTRASPLAMAQAHETESRLRDALGWGPDQLVLRPMTSTGDMILNRPLAEAGGKGLFTKELDEALLAGAIDLAVHSAKDLPTALPAGLEILGFLPREDVRDVLITRLADGIAGLPPATIVGTASARRAALLLRARPDLEVVLMRGNVGSRLGKLERGEVGATLLALAGLKRLGIAEQPGAVLSVEEFLPAVGQGAIALMARAGDARVAQACAAICDPATGTALAAERAYLAVLDGSCKTPIAGHARATPGGALNFRGLVLRLDGSDIREVALSGPSDDAERLGRDAGQEIRGRLPAGWLAA